MFRQALFAIAAISISGLMIAVTGMQGTGLIG